nr:hypothetical protein HmN_000944300 [Hymenolepis microstoma]
MVVVPLTTNLEEVEDKVFEVGLPEVVSLLRQPRPLRLVGDDLSFYSEVPVKLEVKLIDQTLTLKLHTAHMVRLTIVGDRGVLIH